MAGISPLSSQPVSSTYTPSEQLSLSQLDEVLKFILQSHGSVCSHIGSKTPSSPNHCQFVKWELVAAKSPLMLGSALSSPQGLPQARSQEHGWGLPSPAVLNLKPFRPPEHPEPQRIFSNE